MKDTEPQRKSLIGMRGRLTTVEKGKKVTYEGPIIHEWFVQWNDFSEPVPEGWKDYWRVTIGLSDGATKYSGNSIEVAEERVQIIEN